MAKKSYVDRDLKRVHRKTLLFNSKELKVFNDYCKKYDVSNQSKLMRESIVTYILNKLEEDAPTLFDELREAAKIKERKRIEQKKQTEIRESQQNQTAQLSLF